MHNFKSTTIKQKLIFLIGLLLFACSSPTKTENQASVSETMDTNQTDDNTIDPNSEFKIFPNGLIYSKQTMNKLSHIVDSLNLKFKSCDLNKHFYSKYQTVGCLVKLKMGNIKEAKKDMKNQIPLNEFLIKYPKATIKRDVLVIKNIYINYENKEVVEIKHFDLQNDNGFSIESSDKNIFYKDLQNEWLFEYYEKTDYSEDYIESFYFPNKFTSTELPQKYAQMISYSDCLIDTTQSKFKDNLKEDWVELPENWISLSQKEQKKLLDKMRNIRVIGGCSRDIRPREHAKNIALLSAETSSWEIFLKAHLDIMNDRFERMSDGNYAQGQRNTYIKELEELNINVTDLIFGISFRVENPAKNHYYGSIGRIGRALSETKNRNEIDKGMLSIIADTNLDDYNRVLFYFLFLNYNDYLKDDKIKKINKEKLAFVKDKLPNYIKVGLNIE